MLKRCIHFGLYLIVLTLPITFIMYLYRGEKSILHIKVPIVDILILFVFLLWVVKLISDKSLHKVKMAPAPFWVFLVFALISAAFSGHLVDSFKDVIQIIDYYILGYLIFINNVASIKHLLRLLTMVVIVSSLVMLYGIYQCFILGSNSYLLSSAFDDRQMLAGFFTIFLPILLGLFFIHRSKLLKVVIAASSLGALLLITSIPAFFILCGVALGMMIYLRKPLAIAAVPVVFMIILALPLGIQTKDIRSLKGGFVEPDGLENYYTRIMKNAAMTYKPHIGTIRSGNYKLKVSSSLATVKIVPDDYVQQIMIAGRKDEMFGGGHLIQRILEWQAALNIFKNKPLLGVGIGNYQNEIGYYYESFPKLNTMEPNTQNGYLIILATMGFAGLGAFFWILLYFFRTLYVMLQNRENKKINRLSLGLFGSLLAFSLFNFFCPLVNQITVMPFILVLAFTTILNEAASNEKAEEAF